jgi:hypothetical protein
MSVRLCLDEGFFSNYFGLGRGILGICFYILRKAGLTTASNVRGEWGIQRFFQFITQFDRSEEEFSK